MKHFRHVCCLLPVLLLATDAIAGSLYGAASSTGDSARSLYSIQGDRIDFSRQPFTSLDDCALSWKDELMEGAMEKGVVFYERYENGKPTGEYFSGNLRTGGEHEIDMSSRDIVVRTGKNAGTYKRVGAIHSHPGDFQASMEVVVTEVRQVEISPGVFGSGTVIQTIPDISGSAYGQSTPQTTSDGKNGRNDLSNLVTLHDKAGYVVDHVSQSLVKTEYDEGTGRFRAYEARGSAKVFTQCDYDVCTDGTRAARIRESAAGLDISEEFIENKVAQNAVYDPNRDWNAGPTRQAGANGVASETTAPGVAIGKASASSGAPAIPAEMAALAGQVAAQVGEIQSQRHACTSFKFEKNYIGADRKPYMALYRCTECGQETTVNVRDGETIEDIIAKNKQKAAFSGQAYGFAQSAIQSRVQTQENGGLPPEETELLRILTEYGPASSGIVLSTLSEQGKGPLKAIENRDKQETP